MDIRTQQGVCGISCGDWQAFVVPEVGMNMISVMFRGKEHLRVPESVEFLKSGNTCKFGTPLQLPPNRTRNGEFSFEGKDYTLPITEAARNNNLHGDMHKSPFTVTEKTENSISAVFDNHGVFPFAFRAEVNITADPKGITETITITNTGDGSMPLVFGTHNVFKENGSFTVPIDKCREVDEQAIPTGKLLELTEEQQSFVNGTYKGGTKVDTFFTGLGQTATIGDLKLTVSDNFNSWIVWNGNSDQGFVAIEPQQGAPNALNSGDGLMILKPGEKESYTLRFHK